jgi:hypothetical protein
MTCLTFKTVLIRLWIINRLVAKWRLLLRCQRHSGTLHLYLCCTNRPSGSLRLVPIDRDSRSPSVRRDTDDTKRAPGDTRAIPESGKVVVRSHEMSIGHPPKHCPSPESPHEVGPTGPPSVANENYGSLLGPCRGIIGPACQCDPGIQRSPSEANPEAAALYPVHTGRNPSMVAARLSRGCCWCN